MRNVGMETPNQNQKHPTYPAQPEEQGQKLTSF